MRGSRLAEGAATLGTPGSPPGRTPSPAPIVLDAHALDGKTMDERKSIDDASWSEPDDPDHGIGAGFGRRLAAAHS